MESGIHLIKSVFMSAAEGIIISNSQGIITAVNPKASSMFGYIDDELEGLKISNLIPYNAKNHHEYLRGKYFHNPSPRPMGIGKDLFGKKKDGNVFPLEISLSHFIQNDDAYVAAFITDITLRKQLEHQQQEYLNQLEVMVKERTSDLEKLNIGLMREVNERKTVERELRESQQLYELIANNFPKGAISILNEKFEYLFTGGDDEFQTQSSNESNTSVFISKFPDALKSYISMNLENGLKDINGSCEYEINKRNYIMHTVPIRNENKSIDKLLIVEENITEQKTAEHKIRKALKKEKELNELKSRFVSMASHEFRTPLATILSSTNLIGRYDMGNNAQKVDKHLFRIQSNIKNLTEILNDFLSLEKLESGVSGVNLTVVNPIIFINDLLEEINPLLKPGQYFKFIHEEVKHSFFTDPKVLKNILINIISNAIKYSEEQQCIAINLFSLDQSIRLSIKDEGMGIPEEELNNLFDRFFRAKNVSNIQGTGLGLHIVKKYVTLLNGHVSLESQENVGTTATIELPYGKE